MRNREKIEAYVRKNIYEWQFQTGLGFWAVTLKFKHQTHSDPDMTTMMEVSDSWEYKSLKIHVDSWALAKDKASKKYIHSCIAHEFAHIKNSLAMDTLKWALKRLLMVVDERSAADIERMPLIQDHIDRLVEEEK